MNEELQMDVELEIVELGDAKEETKGLAIGQDHEDVPGKPFLRPL